MEKENIKIESPYKQTIEMAVIYFSRILTEVTRKIHKEQLFEITPEEFSILEVIYLYPGIIQAEIARKSLVRCSYVCKLLTGLEEKGFIKKEQKVKGKKQITFENFLTESGKNLYKKIHSFAVNESQKAFDGREEDLNEFIQNLFKMADYLKEKYKINF